MPFDKERFARNVYHLSKELHYPISRLEEATGVSVGYLSHTFQKGNPTKISIDLAYRIAEELKTSLDQLAEEELNKVAQADAYMLTVATDLLTKTKAREIIWETVDRKNFSGEQPDNPKHQLHPLAQSQDGKLYYHSMYLYDKDRFGAILMGDCYRCSTNVGTFFLSKVKYSCMEDKEGYELYFYTEGELVKLLQGIAIHRTGSKALVLLERLYTAVYKQFIKGDFLSPVVKEKLQQFMNMKKKSKE